jgi:4-hydroxybenzoate polyprenyltransferase
VTGPARRALDASAAGAARAASKPALFARLIKVEHSVYALPFAYAGAFLARRDVPSWPDLIWITVAMVAARSAAMSLNRVADAAIDARNPRTAARELPAGRLRRGEVLVFTALSVALLVVAAFNLSPPCRYLWPVPVAAFILYPYAKRFTALCHYALGLTDGLAPAAAWIAVSGTLAWSPVLLFLSVGLWVGGFDVIYAIFDLDFDQREGIHSIPVALGERRALVVAALSHATAVALLVAVGVLLHLGWVYFVSCAVIAVLLAWPTFQIARRGLSAVGMRFMTVNGLVSVVYGVVVIAVIAAR